MLPLIIISGQAGSGKDTVASFLVKNHGAVAIAQADPMKRLGLVFGFDENALWGPSEARNAIDPKFKSPEQRVETLAQIMGHAPDYVEDLLPGLSTEKKIEAVDALINWARGMMVEAEKDGGLSARKVLQTLGTEWGRQFSKNMWSKYAIKTAMKLLSGGHFYLRTDGAVVGTAEHAPAMVVITDGRFQNEIINVLAAGGKAWRVVAPGVDGSVAEKAGVVGHASEVEQRSIPDTLFEVIMQNDKKQGLAKCEEMVEEAVLWTQNRPAYFATRQDQGLLKIT